ncbi:ABC transporter permease [Siminovitchia fordii]|uniref:ABC transporter permease n=1 Tax=Siminovitchia fordii TaxID=254759 RepID=A0ABQ4K1A7_9BACI|nr:ABC transporter permease [Siminovitchia fordii]GIN18888.1 ABC transporter permease [Siminovitchia fordii]
MYHLMKLELQKYRVNNFFKASIIVIFCMTVLACGIPIIESHENGLEFQTAAHFFTISSAIARGSFTVFAGVLIAKMVISEFKNRTVLVMFSYPVNRKKLIITKLLLIFLFTFVSMIVANLFVNGIFILLNSFFPLVVGLEVTMNDFFNELPRAMLFCFASAGASLVPLYFGMKKYSVPATIVASILVVCISCQSFGPDFSLASIWYIPVTLAFVAFGLVAWTIRHINQIDLE